MQSRKTGKNAAASGERAQAARSPQEPLSPQDRAIWRQVADTVRPLAERGQKPALERRRRKAAAAETSGRQRNAEETDFAALLGLAAGSGAAAGNNSGINNTPKRASAAQKPPAATAPPQAEEAPARARPAALKPPAGALERHAARKLADGRLKIEARLDLHGHSQQAAHDALLYFIRSAHQRGLRYVLVITGKGSAPRSSGVLQRQLPHWLAAAAFRPYIAAVSHAARARGGAGAFYVRLHR